MLLLSGGICGLLVLALMPLQSRADEDQAKKLKLVDERPYLLIGSTWKPICGHYFWDNNVGASIVCKKLGYPQGGTLEAERNSYDEDAFYVGQCGSNDITDLENGCSKPNLVAPHDCKKGRPVSIKIKCKGRKGRKGSCYMTNSKYEPKDDISGQGRTVEESPEACKRRCLTVSGCTYFSFWNDGGCHLSSSAATRQSAQGVTAGLKSCSRGCYYLPLGCWKDKRGDRTMPSLEGTDKRLEGKDKPYIFRPIDLCFQVAASKGLSAFAIQDSTKGTCMGGPNALDTYNKHGCDKDGCKKCWLGLGGHYKNDVYQIICDDINVIKQDYMALVNDGSKQYRDAARTMLPVLLKADAIEENEIGVSSELTDPTDPKNSYPWGLLTGDDIIKTRVLEKWVRINGTVIKKIGQRTYTDAYRRTTGMYAEAGTIVTIDIPKKLVGKLSVFIGPFKWERTYSYEYKMENSTQKIGSVWGGLISIFLEDIDATTAYGGDGMFDIRIQNAVEAPYFVYGENTNDEWNNSIKKQAAPYAILLIPGQVQIYVQTYLLKRVTDMEKVVEEYKKAFDIADDLVGLPVGLKPGEEQIHMYPGACWRAGGCNEGGGSSFCGIGNPLEKNPNWKFSRNNGGIYHEMGHGFCFPDLPSASSQMWAELVREYIERTKGNIPMSKRAGDDTFYLLFRMVSFHKFSKGKGCGVNSFSKHNERSYKTSGYQNCWYYIYRLPLYEFGWDMFKKMMNLDAVATQSYKSNNERLVDLYCKATGRNLIPMFHFYNIQASKAIEESCRKQPSPDRITQLLDIAKCLLNKDKDIMECSKLPGFPAHKGICTLSGLCSLNKDLNKSTKMTNEFDLWGSASGYGGDYNKKESYQQYKNTSMVKENCLGRAREMFEWCDNTQEEQKITATFISNDGTSQSQSFSAIPPEGNCYHDSPRLLGRHKKSSSKMTPDMCKKECSGSDYKYYGVQYGEECWCGKNEPSVKKKREMSECNMPCRGDGSKFCGAASRMNIYKL